MLRGKPVPGLTDISARDFGEAVGLLRRMRLLDPPPETNDGTLSTHPLIREHFRRRFIAQMPQSYREAHRRLAVHLLEASPDSPDVIEQIEPLLQAMTHACKAGWYKFALDDIYRRRILTLKLGRAAARGLHAHLVTTLSHLFDDQDWLRRIQPSPADGQAFSDRDSLFVLFQAGMHLTATNGYAAHEGGDVYGRAERLAEAIGDLESMVTALYGLWRFHLVRSELERAEGLATRLHGLTRTLAKPWKALALRSRLSTHFYRGEFSEGIAAYRDEIGDEDPASYASGVELSANILDGEPAVTLSSYFALCQWVVGDAEAAHRANERSLGIANDLGQPHTLAVALFFDSLLLDLSDNLAALKGQAASICDVTARANLAFWNAAGSFMLARAQAATATTGVDRRAYYSEMETALQRWFDTGARLVGPFWCSRLAMEAIEVGELDAARSHLDRAAALAADSGETWSEPEVLRLEGRLYFARAARGDGALSLRATAEEKFLEAIHVASGQKARMMVRRIRSDMHARGLAPDLLRDDSRDDPA